MRREQYPDDWEDLSFRLREEVGWQCEWCGIKSGTRVLGTKGRFYRIVLTVAHLGTDYPDGRKGDPHDKMDVRRENLAVLCPTCHLRYDHKDHKRHAAETRRRRKLQAGQLILLEDAHVLGDLPESNPRS